MIPCKIYNGLAISKNKGELYPMRKAMYAILFLFTDFEDPCYRHQFCPRIADTWCKLIRLISINLQLVFLCGSITLFFQFLKSYNLMSFLINVYMEKLRTQMSLYIQLFGQKSSKMFLLADTGNGDLFCCFTI